MGGLVRGVVFGDRGAVRVSSFFDDGHHCAHSDRHYQYVFLSYINQKTVHVNRSCRTGSK